MAWLRRATIVCLIVYWAAMFLGTHLPQQAVPGIPASDKVMHVVGYAGLALLFALSLARRRPTVGKILVVAVVLVVYGALDEWTQSFVPGRQSEFLDWCADTVGTGSGLVLYGLCVWISSRFWPAQP